MLSKTKLALWIDEPCLSGLSQLGEFISVEAGQALWRKYEPADYVYLVIEGDIFPDTGYHASGSTWVGPGDALGVVDFILGRNRRSTAWVGETGGTLWRVPRSRFLRNHSQAETTLFTQLLIALAPHVQLRYHAAAVSPERTLDLVANHCDHWHPSVRQAAAILRGKDEWETAIATWNFIQALPYRFGHWNLKASEALQIGYGMCTTKANLQVALLRANGIDSAFARIAVPSDIIRTLLPPGYRGKVKNTIQHIFAAAKLDGRWLPCDASFTTESLEIMASEAPVAARCLGETLQRRRFFNPASTMLETDPFAFDLIQDLARVILKRPFYKASNVDAMNLRLDKAQGSVNRFPVWAEQAQRLAKSNPRAAFQQAYAGITSDIYEHEAPVSEPREALAVMV
jgi:hypothetical protein